MSSTFTDCNLAITSSSYTAVFAAISHTRNADADAIVHLAVTLGTIQDCGYHGHHARDCLGRTRVGGGQALDSGRETLSVLVVASYLSAPGVLPLIKGCASLKAPSGDPMCLVLQNSLAHPIIRVTLLLGSRSNVLSHPAPLILLLHGRSRAGNESAIIYERRPHFFVGRQISAPN
jgi:hypothetical protein